MQTRSMKKKARANKQPIAVLISDVHYSISTIEVADKAMNMAVSKSYELDVPIIVCGDLHDTKANIRGECIKAMLSTIKRCRYTPIILRGNHDSINEKSNESSLEFLKDSAFIVDLGMRQYDFEGNSILKLGWFIPYQHDIDVFRQLISLVPKDKLVFMHQGVQNTNSGHYIHDKSAIPKEWLAGRRVISGHYHTRQHIKLPEGGMLSYVGNPYTLNFGEASDPEKGYQILYDDGSLEFIPTKLRRHIVVGIDPSLRIESLLCNKDDIILVKVRGSTDELSTITKEKIAELLEISQSFRLDLIPIETTTISNLDNNASQTEMLDSLIDSLQNTTDERKLRLKTLWKNFT